jgi:membrane associated rhomboid family serine protease
MKTRPPRTTIALGAITVGAYLVVAALGINEAAAMAGGFIPARLFGPQFGGGVPAWLTPLTATLLHANLMHLGFNLLMLYFCGREDEVAIGPAGVITLYVIGAYTAAIGQYVAGPHSPIPMIGASGAISALVGAYALLYGKRRQSGARPELARWLHILWLAVAWLGIQLLLGFASATQGIAVAAAAHVGGFIGGLLLARPLLLWRYRKA